MRSLRSYAAAIMTSPPQEWIPPLSAALSERLASAGLQGGISGPGWVSLRTEQGFLWMWVVRGERMVWLTERPLPRRWLELIGRHARSPFSPHLRDGVVEAVDVLVDPEGSVEGVAVRIAPGNRRLCVRFFPRPGAIWLVGAGELARHGRMEGPDLVPREPGASPLDLAEHEAGCHAALAASVLERTSGRIRQQVAQSQKKLQRRQWTLEGDLDRAREGLNDRARADLLAAHLHELSQGADSVELVDFEGRVMEIELDPALPPHANLDRWYKRAAKAERSVAQIEERLTATVREIDVATTQLEELQALPTDSTGSLDAWLDFASAHDLDPRPRDTTATAQKRSAEERLPYWVFRFEDWEIRVGRSASDNDELTLRHSHLRDLWLHAQGVGGSHVIIRSAGRPVPKAIIDDAARIAAQYSKSKTSGTVAVHVTERRYVRKPRKAPAGTVKLDRAETLFVEPGIPDRWTPERDDRGAGRSPT